MIMSSSVSYQVIVFTSYYHSFSCFLYLCKDRAYLSTVIDKHTVHRNLFVKETQVQIQFEVTFETKCYVFDDMIYFLNRNDRI